MDWLEVIQTVALCANTLLLLGIAFMLFTVWATFAPSLPSEMEDIEDDIDEEELGEPLHIYVPPSRSKKGATKRPKSNKK